MKITSIVGCVNVINQITSIRFNLRNSLGQTLELAQLGPSINGQRCSTLILDSDETVTTFEVRYSSTTVLNSVAVITDKLQLQRWGASGGEVKTWNLSETYQLIGLFGTESQGFGIASIGIIVFNAEKCKNGEVNDETTEDTDINEISDESDIESSADDSISTQDDQFTSFEEEDKRFVNIDKDDVLKILIGLLVGLLITIVLAVCVWGKDELNEQARVRPAQIEAKDLEEIRKKIKVENEFNRMQVEEIAVGIPANVNQ